MSTKEPNIKLDAVIPWVNGNDPKWQQKINTYLEQKIDFNKKKDSKRYNSIGEIDIAIKSIIKNAPFFKTIYLVTDHQTPDSFDNLKSLANANGVNIIIIDHSLIYRGYEEFLPTFNSTSIITLLHKIPGLSEHYVIFNDDTFLMRETKVEDFFMKNIPVLRGKWKKYYKDQKTRNIYLKIFKPKKQLKRHKKGTLKQCMQYGAKLAKDNENRYLRRYHTPISIRKSVISNFFDKNETVLKQNIKYKFRDNNHQFVTETLANHLEIKNKSYSLKKTQLTYFRSYKSSLIVKWKLFWFQINKKKLFMTFQSLELADKKTQDYILNWIDKRLS